MPFLSPYVGSLSLHVINSVLFYSSVLVTVLLIPTNPSRYR